MVPHASIHMSRHVLYGTYDASITVLDLPQSISHAQRSTQSLCSLPGPSVPYTTPEPKGTTRELLLASIPDHEQDYHQVIGKLLRSALEHVKSSGHVQEWYRPRVQSDQDWAPFKTTCLTHDDDPWNSDDSPPLVLSSGGNKVCCPRVLNNTVAQNPLLGATDLFVSTHGRFIIPPESTFLCASIEEGTEALETAMRCFLPNDDFDLVLLDPPWSNRSVRRSQAYDTAESQLADPFDQTLPFLNKHVGTSGYVAIWITNKMSIRRRVISGVSRLGFVLHEEWIWLKVTADGEPVTPLNGFWRKPYEVLLVFRRSNRTNQIKHRVVIAVPDVHSRKPHLGSIFEQLLPRKYTALEIFARGLASGWWSWGNEVLKFQHEMSWA